MTHPLQPMPFRALAGLLALGAAGLAPQALAQGHPITPQQTATARQVAQAGVPLSELAPQAPDSYTVQRGDTLWAIASLYLRSPWRWPELWGMNLQELKNPHLIYPGQHLVLDKTGGRALLRTGAAGSDMLPAGAAPIQTVRLAPRVRAEALAPALTTLQARAIEPFLAEPLIVEENELSSAARIVATPETRVMLTQGDRAYARGPADAPLLAGAGQPRAFRVFRQATPLKDPVSGEVLGYEAQYVGKAALLRGETTQDVVRAGGELTNHLVPATIDIVAAKEEMRVGDRLLPEPAREFMSYAPRAPQGPLDGRIVSVHGSAVVNAAQNQVVAINRGRRDGLESGHVLAILKDGRLLTDKTDPAAPRIKLPDERNGLLMVFRTFERLSYALVLEITDGVKVGDRLAPPH